MSDELDRAKLNVELQKLEIDRRKLAIEDRKIRLEKDRQRTERRKIAFDGLYPLATLTIQSLILINGGAAVALATFVANQKGIVPIPTEALGDAMHAFGQGVLLAISAAAVGYLSQYVFMRIETTGRQSWRSCLCEVGLRMAAFALVAWSGWKFLIGTTAAVGAI